MFVCNEAFETPFPAELGPPGTRVFRAVELSDRTAWYLVTFYVTDDPYRLLHTFCCSWDLQILNWLHSGPRFVITAVQQMRPAHGTNPSWEMGSICRVWTAQDEGGLELVIFEDDLGREYEGPLAEAPAGPLQRRKVVAEFSGASAPTRTRPAARPATGRSGPIPPRKGPRKP